MALYGTTPRENYVQKKHNMTYDSSMITGFIVHKEDGTNWMFLNLIRRGFSSLTLNMTLHIYSLTHYNIKN